LEERSPNEFECAVSWSTRYVCVCVCDSRSTLVVAVTPTLSLVVNSRAVVAPASEMNGSNVRGVVAVSCDIDRVVVAAADADVELMTSALLPEHRVIGVAVLARRRRSSVDVVTVSSFAVVSRSLNVMIVCRLEVSA